LAHAGESRRRKNQGADQFRCVVEGELRNEFFVFHQGEARDLPLFRGVAVPPTLPKRELSEMETPMLTRPPNAALAAMASIVVVLLDPNAQNRRAEIAALLQTQSLQTWLAENHGNPLLPVHSG
jgi:hypothetical protein